MCLAIHKTSIVKDRMGYKVFYPRVDGGVVSMCSYAKYKKLYPGMLIIAHKHRLFPVDCTAAGSVITDEGVHGLFRLRDARREGGAGCIIWRCLFLNSVRGSYNAVTSLAAPVVRLLKQVK
jgi:hypothetical protein